MRHGERVIRRSGYLLFGPLCFSQRWTEVSANCRLTETCGRWRRFLLRRFFGVFHRLGKAWSLEETRPVVAISHLRLLESSKCRIAYRGPIRSHLRRAFFHFLFR